MKLTVVGFWGGYPGVNGATTGYLLEEDNFRMLIDCGSGVLSQLQNYCKPSELDAVILTHYHHDHIADIGPLHYARLISRSIDNHQTVLPIYGHGEDAESFSKLKMDGVTEAIAYDPQKELQVGPFKIEFIKTEHPVICYAMRFSNYEGKSFVFTADSSYKEDFVQFSKNADVLLAECNFYAGQDGKAFGHMTSTDCGVLATKSSVKKLILTHLPHFGEHEQLVTEAKKEFSGETILAHGGLCIDIKKT